MMLLPSPAIDTMDAAGSLTARLTRHDASQVLQHAALTAWQRRIIHLRFLHAYSDAEIARYCGCSVQTIRDDFGHLKTLATGCLPSTAQKITRCRATEAA